MIRDINQKVITVSTGPTFNSEQSGDGAINNQGMEVIGGDKGETIDKSQHQGETNVDTGGGEFSGTIENENTINNAEVTIEEAVEGIFDALKSAVVTDPPAEGEIAARPIPGNEPDIAEFEPLPLDSFTDDHPAQIEQEFQTFAAMPPAEFEAMQEAEPEKVESFTGRLKSMWAKCAPVAQKGLAAACRIAGPVLTSVAGGPTFPFSLLIPLVQGIGSELSKE